MNKFSECLFATACAAMLFIACSKNEDPDPKETEIEIETPEFGIWTQSGSSSNTHYSILGANSLSEGSVTLEGKGIDVGTPLDNSAIFRDGYYYFYNSTEGWFGKYQLEDGALSAVKQVPLSHLASLAGHAWIDDHTLVIIGANVDAMAVNYSIIDVNSLKIKNGTVSGLPVLIKGYRYRVGGDLQYKEGKLFFSVVFEYIPNSQLYPRLNTLAVSYPGFVVTHTSTDSHTVGVGSASAKFSTSFVNEQGDMYFLTSWNGVWRTGTISPRLIYRIKAGSDELDKMYILKVQQKIGYKAAAGGLFMDLGDEKAIIKYQKDPEDTHTLFGYAILDLATGQEVRKLTEIPFGGSGEHNVYVENGKAYIAVSSGKGTNYIWIYDSKTDQVTKGLQIQGNYTSISRIDKLE